MTTLTTVGLGCALALTALAAVAATWASVALAARSQSARGSADAIVVLGAEAFPDRPSQELAARLAHGAALWSAGLAPRVICSGGWDGEVCEPMVMAAALVEMGVPASAVEIDDGGSSTHETVAAAADHPRPGTGRVVLVSSPYHLCRLRLEARRAGLDASVSAPACTPITLNRRAHARQCLREVIAIWAMWRRAALPRSTRIERSAPVDGRDLVGAQASRG